MGAGQRLLCVKPFIKGQKNDYNDAEAIAEAALRPNLQTVPEKNQEQLDLQAQHRVRSGLVSRELLSNLVFEICGSCGDLVLV